LPAAERFDVRIERAVKTSDLFVFLVSPQSVTRGKYTLTELSFAREKWGNPSGHVLPVMIAPTPIDAIPIYLRSVSILETEGNVAADTAAQADKLLRRKSQWAAAYFALAGVGTGLLSYLVAQYTPNILKFSIVSSNIDGEVSSDVTVLPGIFFGALIAFCNWMFGLREKFSFGAIVFFTAVSWVLAYNATFLTFSKLEDYTKTITLPAPPGPVPGGLGNDGNSGNSDVNTGDQNFVMPPEKQQPLPLAGVLCGMIGGLVGGAGTLFGVAVVNARVRRIEKLLPILVAAILIGSILQFGLSSSKSVLKTVSFVLLFVCWQAAVAGMIAQVLSNVRSEQE
jgi:hypothetical protein